MLTTPCHDLTMSRYRRLKHPGATLFLTVNLFDRGSDLLTRHIDILRDVARRTKADKPFAIDAWVVLPDHMHCVWTLPEGDTDYSNRVGMLKARFTRELGKLGMVPGRSGDSPTPLANPYGAVGGRAKERGGSLTRRVGRSPDLRDNAAQTRWDESPVWQKRFWEHHIRDEDDYRAHMRYCWINPVNHGLVERPEDWEYSSYRKETDGELK